MSEDTNDTRAPKKTKLTEKDQNEMEGGSSNVECGLVEDNKQIVEIATTTEPTNEQPSPKLFKLNIDCFDEIFEYLSLNSLNAFSQTCKPMHKVVGEYFKRNYLDAKLDVRDKLYVKTKGKSNLFSGFNQYVSKMLLYGYRQQPHHYFASRQNELEPIRHLSMENYKLYKRVVNVIYQILPKLETIKLTSVIIYRNLYEILLQHCENLKILHLFDVIDGCSENRCPWTRKKYINLEYLEFLPISSTNDSMNELIFFFELNPNVRNFSTDANSIWDNRNEFLKSEIQLDLLVITRSLRCIDTKHYVSLFGVLNQLHDKGFFKRLHIHNYGDEINESTSVALGSLHGSIEKISTFSRDANNINILPDLSNLKLLQIPDMKFNDIKSIETKFKNLEGLYIYSAEYDDIPSYILSVVKQLPKLKIFRIKSDLGSVGHILKLKTLNEEREKNFEARKLTIYVPDDTFLKTKWNVENGNINLHLIEMKKFDSCKCFNFWG